MYRLSVLYGQPLDSNHFRSYYTDVHLPLVMKLPGIRGIRYALDIAALDGEAPHFAIFEADFDTEDAMTAALTSSAGHVVAQDVSNYASGWATIIHYPLTELEVE
ncbi:ethyl tert-butyl ether degradation protein EthD [Mycobacteroides stephanolepidis]|uniref:Ethyl tert-butyl ether degradation protein EthD n=1 Tax=[Mycobacterium] stephanolepidis TaxID=1520670 RepID=A0A1Z4ETB5_9MYCO|nr:EthD family reductase [[Mycobacterium] stephanolepidis]BAX96210.1 ethyl tert-butyl ether degradation protein EthD [[Mycobacterium] stephanolepidis]